MTLTIFCNLGGIHRMKTLSRFAAIFSLTAFFIAPSFAWADSPAALEARILDSKRVLDEIMVAPDVSIPEEMLGKAKAIAIYPNVLKAGFIFGGRFGKGVVSAKDASGNWSPVSFSTLGGGSWGLQSGGQATDLILVIMNERGLNGLLSNNFKLGADASVAAGPVGRQTEAGTDLTLSSGILAYSRNRGLFAGVSFDGVVLTQDNHSNSAYYGKLVTSRDVLTGGAVGAQPSSKPLLDALTEYAKRWEKRLAGA